MGEPKELIRALTLKDAVGIGLGAIIGAGIFVVTGVAAGVAGPSFIIGLFIAGLIAAFNGLSSAQLAAVYPQSGGTYEYGYRFLNPAFGFSAGWMFLISKLTAAGVVAIGFGSYFYQLVPILSPLKYSIIAVDVTNQNISVIEKRDNTWNILSMNPATTGVHKPPYASETPIGIFAIQDQKEKMFYTKDGSNEIAGYAPYASRFTNGAYIHGVPTQLPQTRIIEWSNTLGTTPRSHMCVRVASSQAKFVFDLITVKEAVVVVID
jgi:hypothetical protein